MNAIPSYRRLLSPFSAGVEKVATRKLTRGSLVFTETVGASNFGITSPVAYDDAFIVQLRLLTCPRSDFFVDGRYVEGIEHGARSVLIHDLRTCPTADIVDPFHVLYFYLPRRTLDALSDEMRAPAIEVMQAQPRTAGAMDPVVEHLMLTVLPALDSPQEMNDVFAEHLTLALSAHVAAKYGGMRPAQARARGGLSAKLQRRAMEMLDANLDGSVSLTQLAAECGLSVRHFARAFKQSTGMPPHRYLLTRRIESARAMVLESNLSLTEVALACGFSDQSHLTRVFTASVGISPGALRRARHSR